MSVKKVRFYHYILTLMFPPFVYFFVGRPFTGILAVIIWPVFVIPLIMLFGIGLFLWAYTVFGEPSYGNIGAWKRLRYWDRGYEFLD